MLSLPRRARQQNVQIVKRASERLMLLLPAIRSVAQHRRCLAIKLRPALSLSLSLSLSLLLSLMDRAVCVMCMNVRSLCESRSSAIMRACVAHAAVRWPDRPQAKLCGGQRMPAEASGVSPCAKCGCMPSSLQSILNCTSSPNNTFFVLSACASSASRGWMLRLEVTTRSCHWKLPLQSCCKAKLYVYRQLNVCLNN